MSFTPSRPELRLALGLETEEMLRPPCDCTHDDEYGGVQPCGEPAVHRVSVICQAKGCNCAASVHLLCSECLAAWRVFAARDQMRLRVRAL